MSTFLVSCVQLCTGMSVARNVETVCELVGAAAQEGARLVLTPEMTPLYATSKKMLQREVGYEQDDKALGHFCALAREHGLWLLIGSMAVRVGDGFVNRSLLLSPEGSVVARYDKMHLFDVTLPDGRSFEESALYEAGDRVVVGDFSEGLLGLSICYDVRFASLYRALVRAGARFLSIPAAFTDTTGEAHWHVLLRARAIETGSFVFAPAQGGVHENGRRTYGHSLIISPWGEILAEAEGTKPQVISATIDPVKSEEARACIPAMRA